MNTIEASTDPGRETWDNISAIDDIVEFLVSDTSADRSPFMRHVSPLCERGIVTVACLRGNAAAGGVALAAGCDIVMAGRGVVLNPAYRAMGLHGSEFHSFSYLARCGQDRAAAMLRDMLPQSSTESRSTGLVDIELGSASSSTTDIESLAIDQLRLILSSSSTAPIPCAPWSTRPSNSTQRPSATMPLTTWMSSMKRDTYRHRTTPPLVHYRNEELSQMLLDSFHSVRSQRYHQRRYKFIRKVKSDATPARYVRHRPAEQDEEELQAFDDAPGWIRGEEWGWADLEIPKSLDSSEPTRIKLYPKTSSRARVAPPEDLDERPDEESTFSPSVRIATPLPPGAAPADITAVIIPDTIAPPISTRTASVVSVNSALLSDDRAHSTAMTPSSDEDTLPVTPETPSPTRRGFLRRDSKQIPHDINIQPQAHPLSVRTGNVGSPLSPLASESPAASVYSTPSKIKEGNRFRTFSKRLSGAFSLKPPPNRPQLQSIDQQAQQNTVKLAVAGKARPSLSYVRNSFQLNPKENQPIPEPRKSSTVKTIYNPPVVPNADQCEFPCLYDVPSAPEREGTLKSTANAGRP